MLKQKETIEDDLLQQVAKVLKVPVEAIRNFDEQAAINVIGNSYHDNSTSNVNYHYTFNPIDKIVQLYEALVKSEKEKVELLQRMLEGKNKVFISVKVTRKLPTYFYRCPKSIAYMDLYQKFLFLLVKW